MKISDIIRHKGSAVFTITSSDTVATLVGQLAEHNVGAIVVLDADRIVGIVTERDVVRRLAAQGEALLGLPVAEIMTTDVQTCAPHDSVDSVAAAMTAGRFRHLPVTAEAGGLAGIVSIGDVVSSRMRQLETEAGQLEHYITG